LSAAGLPISVLVGAIALVTMPLRKRARSRLRQSGLSSTTLSIASQNAR
jgi:hypothetical protein